VRVLKFSRLLLLDELLLRLLLRLRLRLRRLVVCDRVEGCCGLLFLERAEGRLDAGLSACRALERRGEWIVRPRWLKLRVLGLLMRGCEGIVTARLKSILLLLLLLLLFLLLLPECAEAIRLLVVRSTGPKTRSLKALEARIIVAGWLRLLQAGVAKAILITRGLSLQAKACVLLLLWTDDVTEPIHCGLLLVALVPTCWLRKRRLGRCWSIKERVRVGFFQLFSSKIFLFLAKLDGFGEIGIFLVAFGRSGTSLCIFFSLSLACFDGEAVFEILIVVWPFPPRRSAM